MSGPRSDGDRATSKVLGDFIFRKYPYYDTLDELPQETRDRWIRLMTQASHLSSFIKDSTTAQVLFDYIKWLVMKQESETISLTVRELQSYILDQILSNLKYALENPTQKNLIASEHQIDSFFNELVYISRELNGADLAKTNIRTKLDLIQSHLDEIRGHPEDNTKAALERIISIFALDADVDPFARPNAPTIETPRVSNIVNLNLTSPVDSSVEGGPDGNDLTDERIYKQRRQSDMAGSRAAFNSRLMSSSQPLDTSTPGNSTINPPSSQNTQPLSTPAARLESTSPLNGLPTLPTTAVYPEPISQKIEAIPYFESSHKPKEAYGLNSSNNRDASNSKDTIGLEKKVGSSKSHVQSDFDTEGGSGQKADNSVTSTSNLVSSSQNDKQKQEIESGTQINATGQLEHEEQVANSQTNQLSSSAEFPQSGQPQEVIFSSLNSDADIRVETQDAQPQIAAEKIADETQGIGSPIQEAVISSKDDPNGSAVSEIRNFFQQNSDIFNMIIHQKEQLTTLLNQKDSLDNKQKFDQLEAKLSSIRRQLQGYIDHLSGKNIGMMEKFTLLQDDVNKDRENVIYNLNHLKVDITEATNQLKDAIENRYALITSEMNQTSSEGRENFIKLRDGLGRALRIYSNFFDQKIHTISELIKRLFSRLDDITTLEKDSARFKAALGVVVKELKDLKSGQNEVDARDTKITMIENALQKVQSQLASLQTSELKRSGETSLVAEDRNDKLHEIDAGLGTTRSNVKTLAIQLNKLREEALKYRRSNSSDSTTALNKVEDLKHTLENFINTFDIDKVNNRLEKQTQQFLEFQYEQTKLINETYDMKEDNKKLKQDNNELKEITDGSALKIIELQNLVNRMNRQLVQQAELLRIQSQKIESLESNLQYVRSSDNHRTKLPIMQPTTRRPHLTSEIAASKKSPTTPPLRKRLASAANNIPPVSPNTQTTNTSTVSLSNRPSHSPLKRTAEAVALPEIPLLKVPRLFRSTNKET